MIFKRLNEIVQQLGCTIDDIQEIERDSVAIRLEYTVFDGNKNFSIKSEYGITYQELKLGKVGDKFTANPNPSADEYMLDTAKILYVDDRSVLVRVTEIIKDGIVNFQEFIWFMWIYSSFICFSWWNCQDF